MNRLLSIIISLLVLSGTSHGRGPQVPRLDVPKNQLVGATDHHLEHYVWTPDGRILALYTDTSGDYCAYWYYPPSYTRREQANLPVEAGKSTTHRWRLSADGRWLLWVALQFFPGGHDTGTTAQTGRRGGTYEWNELDLRNGEGCTEQNVYDNPGKTHAVWLRGAAKWCALDATATGWDVALYRPENLDLERRYHIPSPTPLVSREGGFGYGIYDYSLDSTSRDTIWVAGDKYLHPQDIEISELILGSTAGTVRSHTIHLPGGRESIECTLSPDARSVAWILYRKIPVRKTGNAHPKSPLPVGLDGGEQDGDSECSLWISDRDGSHMTELGRMMVNPAYVDIGDLQWSPSGRSVTFRLEGAIYRIACAHDRRRRQHN